jgi:phosphate transport system substrate-binding protein
MRLLKKRRTKLALTAALATMVAATVAGPALAAVNVTGAGASFPAPLYQRWASHFKKARINYQPTGSGAGIAAIKAGTVNFGGSDAPLTSADLSKFGLVQFPSCVGGLVPIVNLPGVGSNKLKLDGATLAGIYLGTIKTWNNAAIKKLNPGLSLPGSQIFVVHRADSSGSTWIFTHYLSAVSGTWASRVGSGTTVKWPVGIGGNGSADVAAKVRQAKGRIGYVEYAYALQARIPFAKLRNKAGSFVSPSLSSFKAAAASAKWSPSAGFATIMVNAGGKGSWPIAGASFVLMKKNTGGGSYPAIHGALQYFDWAYKNSTAKSDATALQYVGIPSSVVTAVEKVWHASIKAGGKAAW